MSSMKAKKEGGNNANRNLGSQLPNVEPKKDLNPRELSSWAKRTGFVSDYSAETSISAWEKSGTSNLDLQLGNGRRGDTQPSNKKTEPTPGQSRPPEGPEITLDSGSGSGSRVKNKEREDFGAENRRARDSHQPPMAVKEEVNRVYAKGPASENSRVVPASAPVPAPAPAPEEENNNYIAKRERVLEIGNYPGGSETPPDGWNVASEMKCGLRDHPGFVLLIYYGLQHYLSLTGSIVLIPLIIIPAMGGSDKDTATVISTMLLITGITTILHTYFGTRLPLVQGSSFVFLAPALVVLNSQELRNLSENKFRHIMRELQGAIILGSIIQTILGVSGLMCLLLKLINPVVVAPTVAAVGLAFFSYGFPQAGSCMEISIPLIFFVLLFSLYLRGISIFGQRLFQIYAVPLSILIVWSLAFFLTAGGAYNYKGCSPNVPSSNIIMDSCVKHAYRMKHCRTDVSNAMRTASWIRIPYPFQWGLPIFHFRSSIIMVFVSLVASVDSSSESVWVVRRVLKGVGIKRLVLTGKPACHQPPTPGIVSRGIALEGFCSILAGIWGSGTGSTTLTENLYTINITKVASRRAIQVGAIFLIVFSFIEKIGAVLASLPLSLAASVLCFIWAVTVALGLSILQYTQTSSVRNISIVGVSLFLGLSIPAYFEQYYSLTAFMLPGYLLPYGAASNGPFSIGNKQVNFALNGVMSLNMVVTLMLAFILDNTVPGNREERGVYVWSGAEDMVTDGEMQADYSCPHRIGRICGCGCIGA